MPIYFEDTLLSIDSYGNGFCVMDNDKHKCKFKNCDLSAAIDFAIGEQRKAIDRNINQGDRIASIMRLTSLKEKEKLIPKSNNR